jgi:hypothetical protein
VTREKLQTQFDLILLSCKAYDQQDVPLVRTAWRRGDLNTAAACEGVHVLVESGRDLEHYLAKLNRTGFPFGKDLCATLCAGEGARWMAGAYSHDWKRMIAAIEAGAGFRAAASRFAVSV